MVAHAGIQKMSINRSSICTPVQPERRYTAWEPPTKPSEHLRYLSIELPGEQNGNAAEMSNVSLSLVLPCYNEVLNIEHTIRDVQQWFAEAHIDGEIIVTDDGSTDGSLGLLHKLQEEMPNLKVVHHETNRGYGAAVRSGCDHADKKWIAFMDSDGQFRAHDLVRLLPLTADADYVTGVRENRADTFQRWLNSRMYNMLVRVVLGVHPSDINCGMKIFRRSIWKTIRPVYATGALINAEMFYALKHMKITWKEAHVPHYPRLAGTPTGANLKVILRTFKELWQLKRSRKSLAAKCAAEQAEAVSLAG
jgi:glycosyltransferase involved in cell wall biosynthesis